MSHTRSSPRSTRPKPASPIPVVSLSSDHIAEAQQKSTDNGLTLDLSYKNIRQISEEVAQELVALGRPNSKEDTSSPVSRLALGFNCLTALPTAFTLLTHVRYLNLKGNAFTSIPDPVTAMPALEVLDLSRNAIRSLPEQPGSLSNLRVFSLSKNKITVLPAYIAQFQSLRILKVDQNPFEYPPMSVMDPKGDLKDQRFMGSWIESVKQWLKADSKLTHRSSVDSTGSEQKLAFRSPIVQPSATFLIPDDRIFSFDSATHSRTTSTDSDTSTYSAIEASLRMSFLPSPAQATRSPKPERPPRLNLNPVPSFIPTATHTDSPTSPAHYLPTPDNSVSSEEDTAKIFGPSQPQHMRNASYAGGSKPSRPSLTAKKSLPDIRLAIPQSTTNIPALPRSTGVPFPENMTESPRALSSYSPSRQDSGFSEGRSESVRTSTDTVVVSSAIRDRPPSITPIDVERNSYFRRLSTLPQSTICKSIPRSLLTLVDAARGILFAVSQVYQTLQHYAVYAIDERLSAVLLKVLDPASNYMLSLINALDRFDAASRRYVPSPTVCRAVVESCRDTVSVFGKAMGVLTLQLKVLATKDDIRYTRQLLLELYGATAEISNSWQNILPCMEEIEPLLKERPPPSSSKLPQSQPSSAPRPQASPYIPYASPASHPPSSFVQPPRSILRSYSAQSPGEESERSRMMRRHAGSFSSKDVEIGKMLPSYIDPLPVTPRLPRNTSNLSINSGISGYRRSWGEHSRHNSQSSLVASSSSSTASSPSIPSKYPIQDPPSNSSTLLDNDAIDAMKVAVDVAPSIWESMEALVGDIVSAKFNVPEALISAKALTKRLSDNIKAVRESDPTADRKALRDDATVFAKTVILLCNVFKNHGAERPLPPDLRTNMIQLMNATEESVMLLHVSSFSPSANRPYSPLISAGIGFGLSTPSLGASPSTSLTTGGSGEDMRDFRIGSGITTTRNALQSNNPRQGLYNSSAAVSRMQAPHQGFKVPSFTRLDNRGRYGGLTSGDEL